MPMSNQPSLNDVRLDRAIDRAVRELMQIDPAPGMRRRVLSRINAPVERHLFLSVRYAFAAAALIVAVSISLIPRQVEPPTPPKAPSPIVSAGAPPIDLEAVLSTSTVSATAVSIPTKSPGISKEPIPMPRITNVFGPRRDGVSATAVREPAVIRVAPETLVPLTIVPLSARPLLIEPLVLGTPPKGGR
jgi:hypothetical protein